MTTLHEKRYRYISKNRVFLNMEAVFSDETQSFVIPFDANPGDTVQIKLRTAINDADAVFLHLCRTAEGERVLPLRVAHSDKLFDYHAVSLTLDSEAFRYYFSVEKHGRKYFYNKNGLQRDANPAFHFRLIPGFKIPEWARGAVMYQIFVDRFYNGDPTNDVVNFEYLYLGTAAKKMEWHKEVASRDIANFYGGDLQGIIDKMPYLSSLGVEVIYLNPIFVSPSNHKYDTQDYDHIDPHYGVIVNDDGDSLGFEKLHNRYATKYISRTTDRQNLTASDALFARMVEVAHQSGIRVILDGVFNHCGCFNKWMDKAGFYASKDYPPGAYADARSPYRDYFLWYDTDWPNNDAYDGWWGNDNHPKLNFENSPELTNYIMGIARKWVSPPYNADGWRLDVAAELGRSPVYNHMFWQRFREEVKAANPEALILAELYGDPSPWLNGNEWDTVMNYDAFMSPITWFLTGVSKHSEESIPSLKNNAMAFENAMRFHMAQYSIHSLQASMNELSNHDHSRFLTRTNGMTGRLHTVGGRAAEAGVNKNILMEAVVFQMTWPGAPTIYYGDEAGLMGWTDPDNRRPYPWGHEDQTLIDLHKELIALRKKYPVLRTGSADFLWTGYGFLSYGRWDDNDKLVVVINNNPTAKEVLLPIWKIGCFDGTMTRIIATFNDGFQLGQLSYPIADGSIRLTAPGHSGLVLAMEK